MSHIISFFLTNKVYLLKFLKFYLSLLNRLAALIV